MVAGAFVEAFGATVGATVAALAAVGAGALVGSGAAGAPVGADADLGASSPQAASTSTDAPALTRRLRDITLFMQHDSLQALTDCYFMWVIRHA